MAGTPYPKPRLSSKPGSARIDERIEGLRELARVQMAGRESRQAVSALEHAMVLAPASTGIRFELARTLWRNGEFDRALAWLSILLKQNDPKAVLLKARVLADSDRAQEAIEAYGQALDLLPESLEARLERAGVALRMGELESAKADLDALLKHKPDSYQALAIRAHLHLEQGKPAEAIDDLTLIPENEQRVDHYLLLAQARRQAAQSPEGIDALFRRGIERFPADGRLYLAHARHLASLRGQNVEAGRRAEALLASLLDGETEKARPHLSPAIRAQARFLLAELLAERGGEAEVIEAHFRLGLELAPNDARGMEGLGRCLLDQGQVGQAVHWLLNAVLSNSERPSVIDSLARALGAIRDEAAVRRWLGLLLSAMPEQAPGLLVHMLHATHETGREAAADDMRREAHRMKNKLAVSASRARAGGHKEEAERLDQLFEDWTRFLSGLRRQAPAPRVHTAAGLIRRAVAQVAPEPNRIQLALAPDLPLLRVDAPATVDAFANLIHNALEASPKDKPVRIALRSIDEGHWLRLAVTDQGPGITTENRDRIFDTGFTEGKPGGSGLGLSIARQVIQAQGGRLTVASAPGGPTTFIALLPAEQAWAPLPSLLLETDSASDQGSDPDT